MEHQSVFSDRYNGIIGALAADFLLTQMLLIGLHLAAYTSMQLETGAASLPSFGYHPRPDLGVGCETLSYNRVIY